MKKAAAASAAALVIGYLGTVIGSEMMNWPQLGPILAVIVMGAVILCALEEKK